MKQDRILYSDDTETGCALIMVDENTSQNEIVVILGSCNTISDAEVDSLEDLLDGCEYMLTQLETNVSSVERIVDIACKKGVKVILNTAPVQPISDELLSKVDLITPNEVEAEILTGVKVDSEEAADKAAEWFFGKGVKRVLITLGGRGVYINTGDKKGIIPAYKVNAIDTTWCRRCLQWRTSGRHWPRIRISGRQQILRMRWLHYLFRKSERHHLCRSEVKSMTF